MTAPVRIAIAGLGTVGGALLDLLEDQRDVIAARCGRQIEIGAVSARNRNLDRGRDISGFRWYDDAVRMASEAEVDIVVELIGGQDGVARGVCETALKAGRHVVTANKALLAHEGFRLAETAEAAGVGLGYEASVAGGIPVIKTLREGLVGNQVSRIYGILNGTCNYILTNMRDSGADFEEVLAEAQALGYAEVDPGFDIDGIDTAHKLALLAAVAFGRRLDFDGVHIEGIRRITAEDIGFAEELGYRIKLLGIACRTVDGLEQRVHPCMVPLATPLAHVEGVFNAVFIESDRAGSSMLEGRGAGAGPTASAVLSDIADIAREKFLPVFSVPTGLLESERTVSIRQHSGPFYVRLSVVDRPGVLADVAAVLRDEQVSVETLIQRARSPGEPVPVVLTMHETTEAAMQRALARISELDPVVEPPCMIRIEHL